MLLPTFLALLAQGKSDLGRDDAKQGYPTFGSVVGEAGDVDLDGIPDVVVGDPDRESDEIAARFWIVSGADGSSVRRFALPPPSASDLARRGSMFRVRGGVDVDRDGTPDLLVMEQPYAEPEPGAVILVSGRTGSIIRRWTALGSHRSDLEWARFVEDVDGDGIPDVGILNMDGARHEAALTIYSCASAAALHSVPVRNECGAYAGGWLPVEQEKQSKFPDFVVALRGVQRCASSVRAYSAATGKVIWEHVAAENSSSSGFSALAAWSDFDADGRREIAVQLGREIHTLSGATGDILLSFAQQGKLDDGSRYGESIDSIGDIDHDGTPDIAFADTESNMWDGAVWVKSGADGRDLWVARPSGLVGRSRSDDVHHFGYQLAGIRDVNGDGIGDLAVGTWAGAAGGPGRAFVLSGKDGSLVFELGRKGADVEVLRTAGKPR